MTQRLPHIAINAQLLAPRGARGYRSAGIHTYIEQLLRHLPEADPDLRLSVFTSRTPADLNPGLDIHATRLPTQQPAIRILWEQLLQPFAVRRLKADLLHAAAFVAPLVRPCPTVITVYDLSFALFPQFFRGFNQTYLRLGTRASVRQARRVIAISHNTRRDVARLYDFPEDRIDVAYPGVDPTLSPAALTKVDRFRNEKGLPAKFLLYFGTLEPRKNLAMLIQAFTRMKTDCPEAQLVLAGGIGWLAEDTLSAVKSSGLADSIRLPGYVPAAEKPLWYSAATAFVYPSTYEGFGLPPLEAMACGTPVIVSKAASLPEVIGEAGLTVEPADPIGWATAMQRLWNDVALRLELRARGLAQSKKFSWRETARQTAAVYQRVLDESHEPI
jgi:glycosyltransferase involved in cell wall biosynthesis